MSDSNMTTQQTSGQSWFYRAWDSDMAWSLRHSPVAAVSLLVFLILAGGAVLAPLIAPYTPFDPATLVLMDGFTPPGETGLGSGSVYWLGTDDQGRDIFSAILYGMRLSIFIGLMAVLLAAMIGVTLGLVAGYFGGWVDAVIMRVADVQLTFPSILIAKLRRCQSSRNPENQHVDQD